VFVRRERGTELERNANLSRVHIVERHNSHEHKAPNQEPVLWRPQVAKRILTATVDSSEGLEDARRPRTSGRSPMSNERHRAGRASRTVCPSIPFVADGGSGASPCYNPESRQHWDSATWSSQPFASARKLMLASALQPHGQGCGRKDLHR
jgi:hypothetical protein